MKRIIIYIFLLLGFAISVTAHTQSIRKVYMWDVTLSMKGKAKGCPNIWKDVKNAIIKEIEYINDQSVEIVIVPFQHEVLKSDIRKEYATPQGKSNLISFIEKYEIPKLWVGNAINGYADTTGNGTTTMTALYAPIKYCLDYITLPDKINFLEFMTDGVSDFEDDKNKFLELVRRWCTVAETKNLYAFYVMLTSEAENEIIKKVKNENKCGRLNFIRPQEQISLNILELTPPEKLTFHTKDDYGKKITLKFTSSTSAYLKDGFKVHIKSNENPFFNIDEICEVSSTDLSISFNPKYKGTYEELRTLCNSGKSYEVVLYIEKAEVEEVKNDLDYALVSIQDNAQTKFHVIATPERKVEIKWE